MALTEKLSAIGNAIREKTGDKGLLTLDAMPAAIASIGGGGDLPTSINKIDGGSFMLSADTTCERYKIYHNLGEIPKGFFVWCEIQDYTAGRNRTIQQVFSHRRTVKQNGSVKSIGTDYFTFFNADGAVFPTQSFNYTTQDKIDREYNAEYVLFNYDSPVYAAGVTYKWLAWV